MTIRDVTVMSKPVPAEIPAKGFYVRLDYMYGDADGNTEKTVGPFTEEQKPLLIEFLNLLQRMQELYANTGKGGWDDYECIPNYNDWFDESEGERGEFGLETEYTPDGSGCVAELTGYDVHWRDGKTLGKYEVVVSAEN